MNIHIIGIAGKMTAPLAVELKKIGHHLTGSDQNLIYPPISILLKKNHIPINQTPITSAIDLAIIGSSYAKFSHTRQEYKRILDLNINHISATKYIAQNIVKTNSIIVAGSFGKTTITGLMTIILKNANLNPSYLIGDVILNKIPSLQITNSNWSVVEGDESINGLDTKAKFLYYPKKYVIITSVNWEHIDSYKTKTENLNAYKKLIQSIPKNGVLIYNPDDPDLVKLVKFCSSPTIAYNQKLKFSSQLIGLYNQQNIQAAYTLAQYLNIPESVIQKSINSYQGISRRLENLGSFNQITFIDDFAQSPPRIKSTLDAISATFPKHKIIVFFEAHASFLAYSKIIPQLKSAFIKADQIILAKINYKHAVSKQDRLEYNHLKLAFGSKLIYLPLYHQIYQYITKNLPTKSVLIHMSSGGAPGIKVFSRIINYFKNQPIKG